MQNLALVSGLIGALLSAALSFGVRAYLDRKARSDSEARLAYVHLVQISQLIAMEIVAVNYIKAYAGERAAEALASKDGAFEPSHKMSVLIAQELQKLSKEKLRETPGIALVPLFLKSQLDSIKESKLTAEQLSRLPKETVLAYSTFLIYLSQVGGMVILWISLFEEQQIPWPSPEQIHDQWLSLKRFFEYARKLRSALVQNGAATTPEAASILKQQITVLNDTIISKLAHEPKIKAAQAEVNAQVADAKEI